MNRLAKSVALSRAARATAARVNGIRRATPRATFERRRQLVADLVQILVQVAPSPRRPSRSIGSTSTKRKSCTLSCSSLHRPGHQPVVPPPPLPNVRLRVLQIGEQLAADRLRQHLDRRQLLAREVVRDMGGVVGHARIVRLTRSRRRRLPRRMVPATLRGRVITPDTLTRRKRGTQINRSQNARGLSGSRQPLSGLTISSFSRRMARR